jgi:hypothetical protein
MLPKEVVLKVGPQAGSVLGLGGSGEMKCRPFVFLSGLWVHLPTP